jgi:hypothetical protein
LCLIATCACSGNEHPDFLPEGSTGGRGGSSGEAQTGSTGTGSTDTGGSKNTGSTGTGSTGNSPFDPGQVYWVGKSRLEEGKILVKNGFASTAAPTEAIYGLSTKRGGRLLGDRFLYAEPGRIIELRPNSGNDSNPEANDVERPTPPCEDKVVAFEPTPDGRLLYTCEADFSIWHEDGVVVHEGTFVQLGNGGRIMPTTTTWGELGSDAAIEIEGRPEQRYLRGLRANGDGFHAVYGPEVGLERELWSIENAVATKLGDYALPQGLINYKGAALAADDTFYWFGGIEGEVGAIVATTIGGDSVVVHVDSEEAPIELDPHPLIDVPIITGP